MPTLLLHPTAYRTASDEQLVDLVRSGDDRAFTAIHDRYEARLHAYARQLLGGAHHDAEEVVQDAFVRALRALRADDREMALKAWLYTIVRNRALDVLRRPVRTTDIEPHAPMLRDTAPDPCERFVRSEELGALVAGLKAAARAPAHRRSSSTRWAAPRTRRSPARLAVTTGGSKALVSRAPRGAGGRARGRLSARVRRDARASRPSACSRGVGSRKTCHTAGTSLRSSSSISSAMRSTSSAPRPSATSTCAATSSWSGASAIVKRSTTSIDARAAVDDVLDRRALLGLGRLPDEQLVVWWPRRDRDAGEQHGDRERRDAVPRPGCR